MPHPISSSSRSETSRLAIENRSNSRSPAWLVTGVAWLGIAQALGLGCGGSRDPVLGSTTSRGGAGGEVNAAGGTAGVHPGGAGGVAGVLITIKPAWDWNGVIGTGQSLAVGNQPVTSNKQLYNNLMLSLGAATVPPWDPALPELSMVPLIERKNNVGYPAPYPKNLWGETPHSAMANQITQLVQFASGSDFVTVHSIVGETGQGMVALQKQTGDTTGTTGRAYAASLFEATAITRLALAAGKTYGVGAIVMTHGETDSGSSTYKAELIQLLADYNKDLPAITGQASKIPMLLSQQFAYPGGAGQRPAANQLQWQLGVERPGEFVCTGPKYQYPGHADHVHLAAAGYQQLGEKTGQVYYERIVLGRDWQPLHPLEVTREGRVINVKFHVPVPPLAWEETFPAPTNDWPNGKGFEVRRGGAIIAIDSVSIEGDTVKIACGSDLPATGLIVGYAMSAGATPMAVASHAPRWGLLRDSDPFVGSTTKAAQPNYAVSFELPVP